MKERPNYLFRTHINFLHQLHRLKALLISCLVALFACLFFLLFGRSTNQSNIAATFTHLSPTVPPTSTKWWIKATPSLPTVYPSSVITPNSTDTSGRDCLPDVLSKLKPGFYAYISLTPPLPNRLRSGAGESFANIGQIEPGAGVKAIDGPLCEGGFSWWLVEMNNSPLKGWTAIGNGSEQWIIPCTDPDIPCSEVPITPATSIVATQDNDYNSCKSYMFAIGMFSQVKHSDLLVIRSEPYTGAVIGYAGPGSKVRIIDGPSCAGKTIWWKVNNSNNNLTGWTTEANLTSCSKEECP